MTQRYWASAGLFAAVFAILTMLLAWLFVPVLTFVAPVVAVGLYALGLWLDLAPPGKPGSSGDAPSRFVPGPRRGAFAAAAVDDPPIFEPPAGDVYGDSDFDFVPGPGAVAEETGRQGLSDTALVIGVLSLVTLALAALAFVTLVGGGDDENVATDQSGGDNGAVPAPESPTPEPTNTPAPTSTPVPATATPEPTETPVPPTDTPVPPTATPEPPTPTPPPPTERPGRGDQGSDVASLTGTWRVVDTVTSGEDSGESFEFEVEIEQSARGIIGGAGGGLVLLGERRGREVEVAYQRVGGSGIFSWTIQSENTLTGTFEDFAAGNSGTSVAERLD